MISKILGRDTRGFGTADERNLDGVEGSAPNDILALLTAFAAHFKT